MSDGVFESTEPGSARRARPVAIDQAIDALRGRFFTVAPGSPRTRRPTDATMLGFSLIAFAVVALRVDDPPGKFERALTSVLTALPSFVDPFWRIVHDLLVVWALAILVSALFRKQWLAVGSSVAAVALVFGSGSTASRLVYGHWPTFRVDVFDVRPGVQYPSVWLAVWVAVASVASAYLARPFRRFGRSLIFGAALSSMALRSTTPSAAIGAVALGLACAATAHLIFGSPGGMPDAQRVRQVLLSMGIVAEPTSIERRRGAVMVRAVGVDSDDLVAKIYDRDAWDGQFLVKLWRFFWYRDTGPTLALSRLQQVEHEAFLTLLAERHGVAVDSVVAADRNVIGDAVLVVRRNGPLLEETDTPPTAAQLASFWEALAGLHRNRIAHSALDAEHLRVIGDRGAIADLSSGFVTSDEADFVKDRAQLLVTIAAAADVPAAIAAARHALGDEALGDVVSYIQPAALTSHQRRYCAETGFDVDALREGIRSELSLEQRDLQKLRRISISGVVTSVVMFVAGYILIAQLTEVGVDTLLEAMRDASIAVLVGAFCISSFGRFLAALGLSGISPSRVPLGRLTMLQFAQSFVNLAMPSTAGRVAINIRFFQRNGVEPTTAVAMGALDGFTGFICQLLLLGSILLFGLGSLNLDLQANFDMDRIGKLVVSLAIALVVGLAVVALVPVLRNWVLDKFRKVREFLVPFLKSPQRVAVAFGANFASELVGALTLFTVLTAFGQSVSYLDVVLVSITVSLFAGLMPVPGGIGVTEAALTAGFIAIGVTDATAFAAALTCRMITFYLPPFIGAFAFRSLRNDGFL